MPPIEFIAFDADDTLWHNETTFTQSQNKFKALLAQYHTPEWIEDRLHANDMRNLPQYGYGVKGFTLSMIETAIELTEGRIQGSEIQQIIAWAKEMLEFPIQLLEPVASVIPQLAKSYPLMVITKGDLLDQEVKLMRSGLLEHFTHVEVVSEKRAANYQKALKRYAIAPEKFLMIGNAVRSDILPVLEIGGRAVYVPYHSIWAHEHAELPRFHDGYYEIEHLGHLPALLEQIGR